MTDPGPPQYHDPHREGYVNHAVTVVKGLTLQNVLVVGMLLLMFTLVGLLWKIINNDKLLDTILSTYTELPTPVGDCGVRVASPRGGQPTWFISYSFAFNGTDRWAVVVNSPTEPTDDRAKAYCQTLANVIEYALDPAHQPEPKFPGSDKFMFPPDNTVPTAARDIPTDRVAPQP